MLVLPYLDEEPRYQAFDLEAPFSVFSTMTAPNITEQMRPLSKYQCPSDPNAKAAMPNLNYRGVQGGGALDDADCTSNGNRVWFKTGPLHTNSSIRLGDILDGTSNTFLLGETRWYITAENFSSPQTWATGIHISGGGNHLTSTITAAVDQINDPFFEFDPAVRFENNSQAGLGFATTTRCFGSYHSGGCHFALADGSVHFVSENISLGIYRSLGHRNDGGPSGGF